MPVVLDIGGEFFRVQPSGLGTGYPYALEHEAGRIGVGESSNMPAWKVSPSAEALHLRGPLGVVAFFRSVLESLTGGPVVLACSRWRSHADMAGLVITTADEANFVCRADKYASWREAGVVQTHWWGVRGDTSLRGYDKQAEMEATGRGGYLREFWAAAGLTVGEPVMRIEAQLRRRTLRQFGVMSAEDAIEHAGELWVYMTDKWLRWTDPSTASRATRADADPRWTAVQHASIAAGARAGERRSTEHHAPQLDRLVPMVNGLLVSVGAALGTDNPNVALRRLGLLMAAYRDDNDRDFTAEVRAKRLEFGYFGNVARVGLTPS